MAASALLAMSLAACGTTTYSPPTGPYATPEKSAPEAVALRGCTPDHPASSTQLDHLRILSLRQESDLQRIDDDLTGAVPGGNLATDTDLAVKQAQTMVDDVGTSDICPALKDPVNAKLRALLQADVQTYQAAHGGGDTSSTLAAARAAFNDLAGYLRR